MLDFHLCERDRGVASSSRRSVVFLRSESVYRSKLVYSKKIRPCAGSHPSRAQWKIGNLHIQIRRRSASQKRRSAFRPCEFLPPFQPSFSAQGAVARKYQLRRDRSLRELTGTTPC